MDMNIRYNQLRSYTEMSTSAKSVTIDDAQIDLLSNMCIYKIYEKFRLLHKYDHIIEKDGDTYRYNLPEDCIIPIEFSKIPNTDAYRVGTSTLTVVSPLNPLPIEQNAIKTDNVPFNVKNAPIRYTGNHELDIFFNEIGADTVYVKYLAAPMKLCDDDVVFSQQYLEPYMTYMNFILHRMVGFKDLDNLSISKVEWLESIASIKDEALNYTERSDTDNYLPNNGFV